MADHDHMYDDEELVSSNPNQRNWRGILIALLVIIAVLALIVTSVALLTPPDDSTRIKGDPLTFGQLVKDYLLPKFFNGTWVSNQHICYGDYYGGISLMDVSDPNSTARILMPKEIVGSLNPAKFFLSPDHKYLLLAKNVKELFRYSYWAQYTIYDVNTHDTIPLTPYPEKDPHPYLMMAKWTPRGHGIVMIQDYDIYYKTGPLSNMAYRVTNTAVPGILSNGLPDWLYEEEILHSAEAVWLSKDGHMMLYASFNDSLVKEVHSVKYLDNQYPTMRHLRYPKPGTPNPTVNLYVADLADPKNINTKLVRPPTFILNHEDYYFTTASWISLTEVCITWTTRRQNISIVSVCKSPLWHCQEIQRIGGEGRGWVDTPAETPIFSFNGSSYVTIAPVQSGSAGYFKHIVWVNVLKKQVVPLTHGKFEVVKILAWNQNNETIYFIGIPPSHPGQRHLYRVSSVPQQGGKVHSAVCITCTDSSKVENRYALAEGQNNIHHSEINDNWINKNDWNHQTINLVKKEEQPLHDEHDNDLENKTNHQNESKNQVACQYHSAIFSPSYEYFILECHGPCIPSVSLYKTEMPAPRFIALLQNNSLIHERLAKVALPQIKTFPVQISGGYDAQVKLHLPPGLRDEEITRYPMVIQVNGAPGTQSVNEMFKIDWGTVLASEKNMIVVEIDGRGSGGQGYQLMHEVYHRLGTVEVADQLEVTEYLRDSLHFVDKRRVAIWGWSYGGFVAAHALAVPDQDVFNCGISVAPIVNWELYNSVYTERYLGLLNKSEANYKGYQDANLCNKFNSLSEQEQEKPRDPEKQKKKKQKKMFYLVHGTSDNNVQFQHSMTLARHLAKKDILFQQQVYPDSGHHLSTYKKHLYESMANFLNECFHKQVPVETKSGLSSGGSVLDDDDENDNKAL